MTPTSLEALIPSLQTAIGPVILVSGVGLLMLSMTNRYARIFDRTHFISQRLPSADASERQDYVAQLKYLLRQAKLIRAAISLAATSVFFAALLVMTLFVSASFGAESVMLLSVLFLLCLLCLVGSLAAFLVDINMSLKTLQIEVGHARQALIDEKPH